MSPTNQQLRSCPQCGRAIYFDGLCLDCRVKNERDRILALTQDDIDEAIREICTEMNEHHTLDEKRELFEKLVQYRDVNTSTTAEIAFQQGIFIPAELYKDASDTIVDGLIALFTKSTDSLRADKLMRCLAVRGGKTVFDFFTNLEKHPEEWNEKLHVGPSFYANYGGWSFDKDLNFVRTNFDPCYPMVEGSAEERAASPVKIGMPTEERCPDCGSPLVDLMQIDGRDPRLGFIGVDGVIKARCCLNCIVLSDFNFCRYTLNGESELLPKKEPAPTEVFITEAEIDELCSNLYMLGDGPVSPRYAADWDSGSSVGGFAFWIQDCCIMNCPECGKPMRYLAQVQWDTVNRYEEGNAYIEICRDCRILALLHQQT